MKPALAQPTLSVDAALARATEMLAAGRPDLAQEQAQEVLTVLPTHPHAQLLVAQAYCAQGRAPQALDILEPLARQQLLSADIQYALAVALGQVGRRADAVAALKVALRQKPTIPHAWTRLADHLRALGDAAAANRAYLGHVQYAAHDPQLLAAGLALHDGRIPDAEQRLREILKAHPTDVAAMRMLAELAIRITRLEDAEALLERCLELAPGFAPARQNYALALSRANKLGQALEQVERLLADEPRNPSHRNLKAVVLARVGEYAQAIELYSALLEEYPHSPHIWQSYGHALKTAGRQEEAIAAYRRAIALDPGFGEAYWSLANLKTVRFSAEDQAQMRGQLTRAELDTDARLHFEFALGKALEDTRRFADAFAHYARGNELRRELAPYRAGEITARVERTKATMTREFFAQRPDHGAQARDPIFIVGLPRAGSTLIEQILSSHSQVEGTMELPEVNALTREIRLHSEDPTTPTYHQALSAMDAGQLRALGEQYLERTRIQRKSGAPMFIDKMPNNWLHVGLIHLILPNARIIDARRHPLACGFSGFKQHFASGQNFTYSLDDLGRYYRDYVALMAHYDDILPGRIHRVHYEAMVADTDAQVRALLDYCGLPFEEGCLRFFESSRAVRTASSEQVRQPIYREGVEHWRHFEPWLGPLKAALGSALETYPYPAGQGG